MATLGTDALLTEDDVLPVEVVLVAATDNGIPNKATS